MEKSWITATKKNLPEDENFYILYFGKTKGITNRYGWGTYWHSGEIGWHNENGDKLYGVTHYHVKPDAPKS